MNGNVRAIRRIIFGTIVVTVTAGLYGCSIAEKSSVKNIYDDQQKQLESQERKDQNRKIADQVLDNLKKNADKNMKDAAKAAEKASQSKPDDVNKTFEERMDDVGKKMNQAVWGGSLSILLALQGVAIPLCLTLILLGGLMAYLFRKDKPKFKFFLFVAIGGPMILLILMYLPAFLWYLIK